MDAVLTTADAAPDGPSDRTPEPGAPTPVPSIAELRQLLAQVPDPVALLEALFAHLPVALQVYRADGQSLLVNEAFRRLFGTTPPPSYNVLRDEIAEREGVLPLVRRAFAGEVVRTPPMFYDPRELRQVEVVAGRRVGIEATFVPLFARDGAVAHVAVLFADVTRELELAGDAESAQRAAETERDAQRRLAEASALLATSLEYEVTVAQVARLVVPWLADMAGIYVLEDDGTISQLAVAHVDADKEPLLWELHGLIPLHIGQDRMLPRALRSGETQIATEIPAQLQSDWSAAPRAAQLLQQLALRSYAAIPLRARGRVLGALAMSLGESARSFGARELALAEDLAQRVAIALDNARLYREAQDASRLKDDFLATVSHELRTPLQAILGWSRLLRTRQLEDAKRVRALETIERNALSQAQLIDDLLDISRIVTGKLRLNIGAVEPAQVLELALESIRPAADAKGVRLHKLVDGDAPPTVLADPDRLQQIVWNLLSNAVKFTPAEGDVRAHITARGGQLEITVSDTGQGIAPEFLPHVFERFRQADSSSMRKHGGLGLGLAIVRHLVELHGGAVQVTSEGAGRGASFVVRIPALAARPSRAVTELILGTSERRLEGLRVLVVDDAADARELIAATLENAGASVRAVATAADGLAAMERDAYDVLVSDIEMPGRTGYELVRELRGRGAERGGRVPALALTAYARFEDRTRALSAGFNAHVAKPVAPAELVLAVGGLVGRF